MRRLFPALIITLAIAGCATKNKVRAPAGRMDLQVRGATGVVPDPKGVVQLKLGFDTSACPTWGTSRFAVYTLHEGSMGIFAESYSDPFEVTLPRPQLTLNLRLPHENHFEGIAICPDFGKQGHWIDPNASCYGQFPKDAASKANLSIKLPKCTKKNAKPIQVMSDGEG